jgi:hypothetical protein
MANDLASLFAKKKPNADQHTTKPIDSNESGQVPPEAPAATSSTPKPANPFSRGSVPGGSESGRTTEPDGGSGTAGEDAGSGDQPESRLANVFGSARAADTSGPASEVDAPSLDSLESLDSTTVEGVEPRGSSVTYFADETPASKPTRELPEDLTAEQLGFIGSLDSVYEVLHDPELLGGFITNIMVELKSNPEYTKLIAPEDVRVMVRGMRESMGLARVKKQEAKAKRGGARKGSKALDADMLADLDSLNISI